MHTIFVLCAILHVIKSQGGLMVGVAVPSNITDTLLNITELQPASPLVSIQVQPAILPDVSQPIPQLHVNPAQSGRPMTPQVLPQLIMNSSEAHPVLNGEIASIVDPNPAAISYIKLNESIPIDAIQHHNNTDSHPIAPAVMPANWTNVNIDWVEEEVLLADTVDHILGDVNISKCGRDTLDYIFAKDLNPSTVRTVLKALRNEVGPEEQEGFIKAAAKLDGLYRKRKRLIGELIEMSEATPEEAQQMSEYLKTLKVTSILNEVNQGPSESNATSHIGGLSQKMKGWSRVLLDRRNETLHHFKNTANVLA